MNNLKSKEKNLNSLIDKLSNLSSTYSQSTYETNQIQKVNSIKKRPPTGGLF